MDNQVALAKLVTGIIVQLGSAKIVSGIVINNVPINNLPSTVIVFITRIALGMMLGSLVNRYTDEMIEWIAKVVKTRQNVRVYSS